MTRINVAIVGCGLISSRWIRTLSRIADVTVVAVVDANLDLMALEERLGLPAFRSVADLPSNVEAAAVLTPPETHYHLAVELLTSGRSVLVEKPLTTSLREAEDLITRADKLGLYLSVMRNHALDTRFIEFVSRARPIVADRPFGVSVTSIVSLPARGFRQDLRSPIVDDMLVHTFDQLTCLLGGAVEWKVAAAWTAGGATHPATAVSLQLDEDSSFHYFGAFVSDKAGSTPAPGSWRVEGPSGCLAWDGAGLLVGSDRLHIDLGIPPVSSFERCVEDMVADLRDGTRYRAAGKPELEVLRKLDEVRVAAGWS